MWLGTRELSGSPPRSVPDEGNYRKATGSPSWYGHESRTIQDRELASLFCGSHRFPPVPMIGVPAAKGERDAIESK